MNYQSGPEEPKRIDELSTRAPLATDFIPICPANGPTYKTSLKDIADLTPSPIPPIGPGNVGQILSVGGGLSPEWVTASAGGGGGTVLPDGDAINSCLVWHVPTGAWVPARLVQEAQNIHSGGVGTIPYQIGEHKTAHLNIGTKGQILTVEQLSPTMFLPKWADAAAGLPVSSIADASKVLTVKADGSGAEWVADAKELPTIGTKGQVLTVAEGSPGVFTPKWENAAVELPAVTVADAGSRLSVNLDGTGVVWSHAYMADTESNNFVLALWAKTGVLSVSGPIAMSRFYPNVASAGITSLTMNGLIHLGILRMSTTSSNTIEHLSFPHLTTIGLIQNFQGPSIKTLSLPSLNMVSGIFGFNNMVNLTSITFGTLIYLDQFSLTGAPLLTSLNLYCDTIAQSLIIGPCATLKTFTTTVRRLGGNFTITGCALDAASVTNTLARLVAMNGKNGTSEYGSGKTVDLSGGTSAGLAALTPAAIADKNALIARGCTVTLNP